VLFPAPIPPQTPRTRTELSVCGSDVGVGIDVGVGVDIARTVDRTSALDEKEEDDEDDEDDDNNQPNVGGISDAKSASRTKQILLVRLRLQQTYGISRQQ